jgi:hypothetical protein
MAKYIKASPSPHRKPVQKPPTERREARSNKKSVVRHLERSSKRFAEAMKALAKR